MTQMSMCAGVDTDLFKVGEALRRDLFSHSLQKTMDSVGRGKT